MIKKLLAFIDSVLGYLTGNKRAKYEDEKKVTSILPIENTPVDSPQNPVVMHSATSTSDTSTKQQQTDAQDTKPKPLQPMFRKIDYRCWQCGRKAILGDNVCYNCNIK